MPSIPFDYNAFDYEVFTKALLEWLELKAMCASCPMP